jgi:hypothetical protein
MAKTLDDEQYRIPLPNGKYAINLSKWRRENEPQTPKYKVGDMVKFVLNEEVEVLKVYQDCDGTPLYELDMVGNGWSECNIQEASHVQDS